MPESQSRKSVYWATIQGDCGSKSGLKYWTDEMESATVRVGCVLVFVVCGQWRYWKKLQKA